MTSSRNSVSRTPNDGQAPSRATILILLTTPAVTSKLLGLDHHDNNAGPCPSCRATEAKGNPPLSFFQFAQGTTEWQCESCHQRGDLADLAALVHQARPWAELTPEQQVQTYQALSPPPPKEEAPETKPLIVVVNTQQDRELHSTIATLFRRLNDPPWFFLLGGELVRLHDDGDSVSLRPVTDEDLLITLSERADWVRLLKGGETVPTHAPKLQVRTAIFGTPNVAPPLDGLSCLPLLTPSGRLCQSPGYDSDSRRYLHGLPPLLVAPPEDPSDEAVQAAIWAFTVDLLGDFPFADEASATHVLAACLTAIVRPYFTGPNPLFLITGNSAGIGKTLVAMVIGGVVMGQEPSISPIDTRGSEFRKLIGALLSLAAPVYILDNLPADETLNVPALAALATTTRYEDRILGSSRTASYANYAVWVITGNQVQCSREISRRMIPIHLHSKDERPWTRPSSDFRHTDIVSFARTNRGRLVSALLVLVQRWLARGAPLSTNTLGSFEGWASCIGGILEAAGLETFLGNLSILNENVNEEDAQITDFVTAWHETYGSTRVHAHQLLDLCLDKNLLPDVLGSPPEAHQAQRLGKLLRKRNGTVISRWQIVLIQSPGRSRQANQYELVAPQI